MVCRVGRGVAVAVLVFVVGCGGTLYRAPFTCPAHGGPGWTEVATPHFIVLSDAGSRAASNIADELETIHAAFEDLSGMALPSTPRQVERVRVVERAADYLQVAPPGTAGLFKPDGNGVDQVPTLMFYGTRLTEWTTSVIQHELTHSLVHRSIVNPPLWLNEGMAEYMSSFSLDHGVATFGKKPLRLRVLRRSPLPVPSGSDAMSAAPRRFRSPELREGYYVASWALVHVLSHASSDHRKRFRAYLRMLSDGATTAEAWKAAFAEFDLTGLDAAVSAEIVAPQTQVYQGPYKARPIEHATPRALSDAEVHLLWVALLPWNHATKKVILGDLEEADRQSPGDPEAMFWRAKVMQQFKQPAEAERLMRAALQIKPDEPRYRGVLVAAMYELAAYQRGGPERFAPLREPLEAFAQSAHRYRELAAAAWLYATLADLDHAVPLAARAVKENPTCIECIELLATLSIKIGKPDDAVLLQERAIALLPDGLPSARLVERLDRYKAAASAQPSSAGASPTPPSN